MNCSSDLVKKILLMLAIMLLPSAVLAMTAEEILEQVAKQNFGEDFRLIFTVRTFKGKKESSHSSIWLMAQVRPELTSFFLDFEEPEESKGLRFLLQIPLGKEARAFMYLPATGNTIPLAVDDPAVDLGGTGLTLEDMQGFVPESGDRITLVEEQRFQDRDCYVIRVSRQEEKAHRLIWVSKKDFIVVKSQSVDAQGKVVRVFHVTEFFQTKAGREFPREEEITMPGKDVRIVVRQEHAVFGIDIAEEIVNPEEFGTFKWKN